MNADDVEFLKTFIELAVLTQLTGFLAAGEVTEIRFHGNHSVPDTEMASEIGIAVGDDYIDADKDRIEAAMMATDRFEWVDVRSRYRSFSSDGPVALIIVVKEKPPAKKKFMFFPILSITDEYGLTFGGRVTTLDLLGLNERLTFPATLGGLKQASGEASFFLNRPVVDEFVFGGGIAQWENPHYKIEDTRTRFSSEVRKQVGRFHYALHGGWTNARFGPLDDSMLNYGFALTLDGRQEKLLPRDTGFVQFGLNRTHTLDNGPAYNQYTLDLRGFKGLPRRAVLATQVKYTGSSDPLPPYMKPYLGGAATLRGWETGAFVGDNRLISSLEVRIPFNSSLSLHKAGMDLFFDLGTVYDHGQSLSKAKFEKGVGSGLFLFVFGLGFKVELAHNLKGNWRVHFSTGFRF